jgi:hypothetical protein
MLFIYVIVLKTASDGNCNKNRTNYVGRFLFCDRYYSAVQSNYISLDFITEILQNLSR